ncbi:MAG: DUF5696 domain-containing protein [Acutalibacteraceae bacterium]|nr:DUF5696 domain-containing protein [Acutalibacteraceae bacterium]
MKNILKRISLIVVCLLLVLSCTACGDSNNLVSPKVYNPDHANKPSDSFVAAENDKYQLKWDKENKRILLYDKINNKTYCSTPEEVMDPAYAADGKVVNPKLNTSLIVEYVHTEDFTTKTASAYVASLNKSTYELEKIDNGFKIVYHFDNIGISIPVSYTLLEDGMKMSVNPMEICETPEEYVYRITFAPFFVSTPIIAEDSYLFYPSGSGAIINANNSDEISTYISEDVYSEDGIVNRYANIIASNTEYIRMPIFGAKNGNSGVLGIISEGAENAVLEGDIGNYNIGYSGIYPTFYVRGANQASKVLNGLQYSNHYADTIMSVCYYPLENEEADYVGMAKRYRKFLLEEKGMTDKEDKASASISFVGGTSLETSFLGMPTTEIFATTTVKQAQSILTDLSSSLKLPIVADLFGFGSSGIDYGKPAGDLKLAKKIGSDKDVKELADKCKELGIDLYFDYDLLHFSSNGQGLTITRGGSAKGPGLVYSRWRGFTLGNSAADGHTYLVARDELINLGNKTIKDAKSMDVSGVSYRKITSKAYSDYADNRTIAKANMSTDVTTILNNATAEGLKVLANQANDYAAVASDAVIDAPISSSHSYIFDYDVPVYQIVFKGYVSMYGAAINMATQRDLTLLRAIEGGSGIKYTLTNNFSNKLLNSKYQIFNTLMYTDNKEEIVNNVNANADYYTAVADAHIDDHICITNDVRKIVYDNGVSVYVNYSEDDYMTDMGIVPAGSYIYGKEVNQ